MARRDFYHAKVIQALKADGWEITHDPLYLKIGQKRLYIDIGAEKNLIAANRAGEKIAVEIKSFIGPSDINEFEKALGQYDVYHYALQELDPERSLFIAFPRSFHLVLEEENFYLRILNAKGVRFVIFDEISAEIIRWKK